MFLVKGVRKLCSKFTGEHSCRNVISTKLRSNFIEATLRHRCSPVNLLHIFITPFTKNTSERLLLEESPTKSFSYQFLEPKPSIHCSQRTSLNSKGNDKVVTSSVDYPNAVRTTLKKVIQTVHEVKEKPSHRIIIHSSGKQETDLITPSLSTSVLYPSGETVTKTVIPLNLIQISLLSVIALSFILVCILLACMICQKRK